MDQNLYQEHHEAKTIVKDCLGLKAAELFSTLLEQKFLPADVIVFLQGDRFDRMAKVQSLFNDSLANLVFITGNNVLIGQGKRYEENDVHLSKLKERLISEGVPEAAIIIEEQSLNTSDQAVNIIKEAKKRNWCNMLVVSSPYYVLRAYLACVKQAIEQEWPGNIIMQCADLSWEVSPGGRVKTAIEMLKVEMEKIKKYASNLATIEQGNERLGKIANKEMKWHIRLAETRDCRDIWAWRNDPEVRKQSFNSEVIPYSEHQKWFGRKIGDQNAKIYIFEDEKGDKLGQIRFDIDGNSALINICLNPEHFGKGLGKQFIKTGTEFFLKNNTQIQEVTAEVIDQNIASKKAFQKAGYVLLREALEGEDKVITFKKYKE